MKKWWMRIIRFIEWHRPERHGDAVYIPRMGNEQFYATPGERQLSEDVDRFHKARMAQ